MADVRPYNNTVQTDAPRPELTFASLGVPSELTEIMARDGIREPFPIQTATLPDSLAGRDVLGRGKTGSGKTLAFVLPVLTRLSNSTSQRRPGHPRALILAPTRELVSQIHQAIKPLAAPLGLRTVTVFGGVSSGPQIASMRQGVDIVVACPGRLEDLIGQRQVNLESVEITVLDEADHMADLGFLPVVKKLLDRTPKDGQRMLFSATLDNGIDVIVKRYLHDPITHSVDSEQSPVVTMTHHVLHVSAGDRLGVLVDLTSAPGRTMVFTRTKHRAKQLTRQLQAAGVPAVEMHGNLAQNARTRNLAAFSDGRAAAMVATDIAARGIHVDDVTLVIHADPPIEHKAYLHRSGRTARAGAEGTVVTLATEDQRSAVKQLARKAGINPTITQLRVGDPLLTRLAPGTRVLLSEAEVLAAIPTSGDVHRPAGTGKHRPAASGKHRRRRPR
jgi:superfamily II DNA/RNA helicase